jgi:hypothetical protein
LRIPLYIIQNSFRSRKVVTTLNGKRLRKKRGLTIQREKDFHFDGVPLTDEELKPLRDLLEVVVRDRLPKLIQKEKEKHKS